MDFFEAQESARTRTRFMIVVFLFAVFAIAVAVYGLVICMLYSGYFNVENAAQAELVLWQPNLFLGSLTGVVLLVSCCSLFKIAQLRSGGAFVARSLGGREVLKSTDDATERKLLNVVEEMSIASGIPMPAVYILPEGGINAFAAGFKLPDAVIGVTEGCISSLTRDELQGVVAHEFSHILNGDMRMNIRLMGLLFGILAIAVLGEIIFRVSLRSGNGRDRKGGGIILAFIIIGLAVMAIGYIGVFFGRIIQSAISRQREYLADAAAVQFTRNPQGIAGALKKIGGNTLQGRIKNPHSQETAHLFFANAFKSGLVSLFATHPPLKERILKVEPDWDGKFIARIHSKSAKQSLSAKEKAKTPQKVDDFIKSVGHVGAAAILAAQDVHTQIGNYLERVRQSVDSARGALLGLMIVISDSENDSEQFLEVKKQMSDAIYQKTRTWVPQLRAMNIEQRFAVLNVALPVAAGEDLSGFSYFIRLMRELANRDNRIQFQEFALLRAISVFAKERISPRMNLKVSTIAPKQMEMPLCVLLSAIAYTTGQDKVAQVAAFREGARKCNRYLLREALLLPKETVTFEALDMALDLFANLPNPKKKVIFEGTLAVVLADKKITQDELTLIRTIAMSLGLPMPPLIIGKTNS